MDSPATLPVTFDALELRNRQISAVLQISRLLSSTLDLDQRLKDILNVSLNATDATAGSIALYHPDRNALVFQYVVGPKEDELTGLTIPATQGVAGAVFRTGEAQITRHEDPTETDKGIGYITRTMMTVALQYQAGKPVGVMQILNRERSDFTNDDLEVVEIIASLAATAIENAQLHRDAQAAAIAHMVGGLSHDIKNKVAPISGWVETLWPMLDDLYINLDGAMKSKEEIDCDSVRLITDDVRTFYPEGFTAIMDQVRAVQEYTKLISDALKGSITEPQIEPNDIDAVVSAQIKELDPIARQRGVTLQTEMQAVPICSFDKLRIEQAIYNLINNALPETPPGGTVTVKVEYEPDGAFPNGAYVGITVSDTGKGMPPPVLDKILNGNAKSTKPGGSGIGTRIVYNAVHAHHGTFHGSSEEGKGTTFQLRIPYLPDA